MRPQPLAVDASAVGQGRELGRGGQGQVVEVPGAGLVAKWYLRPDDLDPAALTRLVAWRRSLPAAQRDAVDLVACWPRAVLLRDGRAAGVLLPRAPSAFADTVRLPSGGSVPVLRELQYLVADEASLARRGRAAVDHGGRLRVLAALAESVALLHQRGVVVGDLSVKNVLWSLTADRAGTYLLDCDALRLTGTNPPLPQVNSPGWDDPAFPGTQNQQSDRYKLALAVLRVVANDFHTRDPERAAAVLGHELLPLVRAGLAARPGARPPASTWAGQLRLRADLITNPTSDEVGANL